MSTELRGPLRSLLDDPVEHEALERVRRKVHASRRMPIAHPWRWAPAAAAVLIAMLGGAAVWSSTLDRESAPMAVVPGPIELDGDPLRSVHEAERIRVALSDGSRIWLGASTRLDAIENAADRVVLAQGDGHATYDVRPHGPRRWTIDAGALTVDVVGTRFTVSRRGPHVRVSVSRGRVRVRGSSVEGGIQTLSAGESIEIGAPVIAPIVEAPIVAPPVPAPAIEEAPRWRALADRGEYSDAFEALGADGLARATERSRSVDELFALADTARLSGHASLAVDPLRRIVDEHARDPRAAVAALTLGRMQLDALNAPAEACDALDRAIALGVPAHLGEVAYARAVEAHHRAGHTDRVAALGREYLERFPEGRSVDRVRAWIAAP